MHYSNTELFSFLIVLAAAATGELELLINDNLQTVNYYFNLGFITNTNLQSTKL